MILGRGGGGKWLNYSSHIHTGGLGVADIRTYIEAFPCQ